MFLQELATTGPRVGCPVARVRRAGPGELAACTGLNVNLNQSEVTTLRSRPEIVHMSAEASEASSSKPKLVLCWP